MTLTIEQLIAGLHRAAERGLAYQSDTNVEEVKSGGGSLATELVTNEASMIEELENENESLRADIYDLKRNNDDLAQECFDLNKELATLKERLN